MRFETIAFDADDTLWHNETNFTVTKERLIALLAGYADPELTEQRLYATEMRNLAIFGYGIKGFTLSMIETAIELTDGRITGHEIQAIIDLAKAMTRAPVQLLPHVAEVIPQLAATHRLMLITKGDLLDQESKIARSGLADYFSQIEIVSDKTEESYRRILARHAIDPQRFMMVGNALRSDVLPVAAIGGRAVFVPYALTWAHEHAPTDGSEGYAEIAHLGLLPALIATLEAALT